MQVEEPVASAPDALFVAYFVVFFALLVGELLFLHGRTPHEKWRWHARLGLLNAVVLGGLMAAIVAGGKQWIALPVLVAAIGFIAYGITRKIRVCEQCGSSIQPQNLLVAAQFCPKCGAPLRPSPLWRGPTDELDV